MPRSWNRQRCRPGLEALEERSLLTAYLVTTTEDLLNHSVPGEVTLRDVLTAINTQAPSGNAPAGTASNTVRFAIGATGSKQTIQVGTGNVAAGLPALTHQAILDGWSQGGPNYHGQPLIVLNGTAAGASADGLRLEAGSNGSTVRGLVIQSFGGDGIEINASSRNLLTANYIGTDSTGTATLGNVGNGVLLVAGARNNTIGGKTVGAGNVISGNGDPAAFAGNGIEMRDAGTTGNAVQGNLIGTDRTGTAALGNALGGILIHGGASNNAVGGAGAGAGNVIVGSLNVPPPGGNPADPAGVLALGTGTISGGVVRFDVAINYRDTPPAEMVFLSIDVRNSSPELAPINPSTNQPDFSAFAFTPSSTLGPGWAPVANPFPGQFQFQTPPPPGDQPADGLAPNATYVVGTLTYDLSKFNIQPSPALVISIAGSETVVGAEAPGDPSSFHFVALTFSTPSQPVVDRPGSAGVEVRGDGTSGNAVVGNRIGTDVTGTTTVGHLDEGVAVRDGATRTIVSTNVLGGNDDGVVISWDGTSSNQVRGNRIGIDQRRMINLGNTLSGVFIEGGATSNLVMNNTIAFNGEGVVIGSSPEDDGTVRNTVLMNSLFGNDGPGIDLGNDGVTPNGANPRPFPNHGQNTPVLTALTINSISGRLISVPNVRYRIEFFATPTGGTDDQGQVFLGARQVTTNPGGGAVFTAVFPPLPRGAVFTATATNLATGDTSELSPAGTQLLVITNPVVTSINQPQVVTVVTQITSDGDPVTSGPVKVTIEGLSVEVIVRPDSKGVVTATLTIPPRTPPGRYIIKVTYPGEGDIPAGSGEGILTVLTGPITRGNPRRRWIR